jgi:WD40 repeat protein
MSDVFISYSRTDKPFVQQLHAALIDRGRDVWIDWEDIPPTAQWRDEIHAGIEQADAFLAVLTPSLIASDVCGEELAYALKHNKRLIPIVREEVPSKEVHPALRAHNWLFCRSEDDFSQTVDKLLAVLDTDLEHVKEHTRLSVRATEWERDGRNTSHVLRGSELARAEAWLSASGEKQPPPAPLHTQYIVASRQAANLRARVWLSGVTLALAVSVILTIVALVQSQIARTNEIAAQEAQARAERNADEALSLLLSSYADAALRDGNVDTAAALAVEAVRMTAPPPKAQRTLAEVAYHPGILVRLPKSVMDFDFALDSQSFYGVMRDDQTADWPNKIGQFDTRTGTLSRYIVNHDAPFLSIDMRFDGKEFLTLDNRYQVHTWDAQTGKKTRAISTFAGLVVTQVWSGRILYGPRAQGSGMPTLAVLTNSYASTVFGLDTGAIVRQIAEPLGNIHTILPTSGIAVSTNRSTLDFWDILTEKIIYRYPNRTDYYDVNLTFSPESEQIYFGDGASLMHLDFSTQPLRAQQIAVMPGKITRLVFRTGDNTLMAGLSDGAIVAVDSLSGFERFRVVGHYTPIQDLAVSPNGAVLMSWAPGNYRGLEDKAGVVLWDVSPRAVHKRLETRDMTPYAVAYSPDGRYVAVGGVAGEIVLYEVESGKAIRDFMGHINAVFSLAFSPDARFLVSGSGDKGAGLPPEEGYALRLWEVETGQQIRSFVGHTASVMNIEVSADGRRLLSASVDGTARLWDLETTKQLQSYPASHVAALSRDGNYVLCAVNDEQGKNFNLLLFKVDDAAKPAPTHTLTGHNGLISSAAISADARYALSGSYDNTLILYDLASGQAMRTFVGHTDVVTDVAFSPGGEWIGSTGRDNILMLWDMATGQVVRRFAEHVNDVDSLSFSSDGKLVAVNEANVFGRDNLPNPFSAKIWRVETTSEINEWIKNNRYVRQLTCEERTQYGLYCLGTRLSR